MAAGIALLLQAALFPSPPATAQSRDALRAGLDTMYGGDFARAAAHFAALAQRDTTDPAPLVFQAGAYIWWGSALDSVAYEQARIDSLLTLAMARAHGQPGRSGDFWLATALGYRARQREENGHGFSAAKDAKTMRDIYEQLLAADSSCFDCYLGLGVYDYGLARANTVSRLFARIIGLGGGDAERGIRYMRRAAHDGDLARVESTWVLAAALMREGARDRAGRAVLEREARGYVETLAARYPGNPLFQRFLKETAGPAGTPSTGEAIRPAARPSAAAIPPAPIGWRERRELPEHVMHVTLHGVRRDVQPLRDLLVAEPRRDQIADFLLAFRQTNGRDACGRRCAAGARAGAFHAGRSGRRRQIGAARDRADRFHDVVRGRVLHDESVGTAVDEFLHVLLRGHEVDHDRLRVGRGRFEIAEKCVTVAVRERGVEQHDLRFRVPERGRATTGILGAGDDLDIGKCGEQTREAIAHETVVFDDEYTNTGSWRRRGTHATISATTVDAVALHHPVIQSAATRWGYPALNAANGPRHTPPPSWLGMYSTPSGDGSNREVESIPRESLF